MEIVARASGLVQGYGQRPVIDGLDIEISTGVLGLLGPNGAGKTTLLRTLASVAPPVAGRIEVLGQSVESESTARRVRRDIGYLPQDFGYYPNFSVYDFVRYCAWLREVPKKEADAATRHAVASVGLEKQSKAKMKSLSGGMLRRAGIATAIVGSPKLVLLDEPTVGLDPAQRLEFRGLIRSLQDTAIVLSTHLVEDVAAICDDTAVMSDGRFLFRGVPDELVALANPDAPGDSALERGYMTVLNSNGMPVA
ncbi:putative ABC transporter ATP-binding protein YxlF [Streptomyces chartreusis NRRL 3882]|uniref:Putative ABC transporter ATP-binding protein YxlF n=1 Tax=Streptomyces chartreusis NRRL 3882 TaxID=1079985 RepID=A0A2N9B9U2_STRCX|nr:putative ABC transporter ATP-binding protein YxlF [Streptomyces chartreusis NRRL 3882]